MSIPLHSDLHSEKLIGQTLRDLGLDAWEDGGWVYVALGNGHTLWIGAEYGASLDAELSPHWPRPA